MPWTTGLWRTYCGHPRRVSFIGWLYISRPEARGKIPASFQKITGREFHCSDVKVRVKEALYFLNGLCDQTATGYLNVARYRPMGDVGQSFVLGKWIIWVHFVFGSCMPSNTTRQFIVTNTLYGQRVDELQYLSIARNAWKMDMLCNCTPPRTFGYSVSLLRAFGEIYFRMLL
jgi:hypothetical protein